MTAAALYTPTVYLPRALPHQRAVLNAVVRFKVWRAGRRTGKSRAGLIAAILGHGQGEFKGVLDGGDIVWVTPDFPQARAIWREEIRPRFAGVPGVTVHETDKRLTLAGLGSLEIRSAENIDSVRGRQFDGAIIDEAAHLDAGYAWQAVLRPALTDRGGWALFISTPNAGHDGNAEKRTPSFFNRLCQEAASGVRGPEWGTWHHTTDDNPKLARAEVAALRAEYPHGSPTLAQEIDADLVAAGVYVLQLGTAHQTELTPADCAAHWHYFAAMDWGYAHPTAMGLFAADQSGRVVLLDAAHAHRTTPPGLADTLGRIVAKWVPEGAHLAYTVAGLDCWHDIKARGEAGPTIAEQFAARKFPLLKATVSRVSGLNNLRRYAEGSSPRLLFNMAAPGVQRVWDTLTGMVADPNDPEDALKVDADVDGRGGDDAYDMVRYALMTRPLGRAPDVPDRVPDNQHPGMDYATGQRQRKWQAWDATPTDAPRVGVSMPSVGVRA